MKICVSCGAINQDDSSFCIVCGRELPPSGDIQPAQRTGPEGSAGAEPPSVRQDPPPFYSGPGGPYACARPAVVQSAREVLASPLMLTILLFMAAQIVLTAVNALASLSRLLFSLRTVVVVPSPVRIAVLIAQMTPGVLLMVGLLMVYVFARAAGRPMSTVGIAFLRVLVILSLMITCFSIAILLFLEVFVLLNGSLFYDLMLRYGLFPSAVKGNPLVFLNVAAVVVLVATAAVGAMQILFLSSAVRLTGSLSRTFQTGCPSSRGAGAFFAFCMVYGCFSAVGALSALMLIDVNGYISAAESFLVSAVGAVVFFLLGALVSKYRRVADSR